MPFLSEPINLKGLPGFKGFDPFGFSELINVKFLQEAGIVLGFDELADVLSLEIKHARVAMLATVGFVATEFVTLPGEAFNVSPIEAHDAAVASGSAFQVLTFIVALEFVSYVAVKQMLDGSGREPGDFGFDPLGFYNGKSLDVKKRLRAQELENGRTAMLAFAGIVTQSVATGKPFPYF